MQSICSAIPGASPGLKLLELYNEEKRIMLPETLANAMEEAKATLARTANPQLADFVLDKAYFTELRAAVDKVDSPFLRGYAAILIDSANLRSAVRTLRMGKGQDFLREVLIPDGNVGAERVANATDKDSLAALYAHSALEKAAVLGGEALSGGSMTAFELACDNAVNDYLKGARLISYGLRGAGRLYGGGRGRDNRDQNDPHGPACGRPLADHPGKAA